MNVPESLKYTKEHEWIKIEGNTGIIGVTDYAQGELGDVVFVDIDPNITEIVSGESFGTIEAVKTVSDLFAPCNGKVLEINEKLTDEPQAVNSDPYGEGWLIKIEISDMEEINSLLSSDDYKAQIA